MMLKKVSGICTSPSLKEQGLESEIAVGKFKLDKKRCEAEQLSNSMDQDMQSDEEVVATSKTMRNCSGVNCSTSEYAKLGLHKDIEQHQDIKIKQNSHCEPSKSNLHKFDTDSDQLNRNSSEKETRPTVSNGNEPHLGCSNKNILISNDSNNLEDSNN